MTDAVAAPMFFPAPAVPRNAPYGTVEKPLPLIIDSDPGLDDALAIGLAVARPEIDLLAVTTVGGNADVRNCTYFATLGDESAAGPGTGQIAVTSAASNVNGVRVVTRNSTGELADRSFHLIVSC